MSHTDTSLTTTLSRYAESSTYANLPSDLIDRANGHILDTLAAIISGSALDAGRAGQAYARSSHGPRMASVLGTDERASMTDAAFANGMAAHADESDDTHERSFVHPGCGILPAALAAAEAYKRSGAELQRAVILGYDIAVRFAEAVGTTASPFRSSLATHSYGPCFGAGFAAGALARFDAEQFGNLLSYLAQEASGVTTWPLDEHHVLKSYVFAAMPASNALRAVRCVEIGFPGGGDVLRLDTRNMLHAVSNEPQPDALTDGLGTRFALLESEIKSRPVGYPVIAPLVAIERLLAQHRPDPTRVRALRVYYHPDWYTVVAASHMPAVSLPYCLAVTLLDGRATFSATHDAARMASPQVKELMDKIHLLAPSPGTARYHARVELDVGDAVLTAEQGGERGAEHSLTGQQLADKAEELMTPVLGRERTHRVVQTALALQDQGDVRPLIQDLTFG